MNKLCKFLTWGFLLILVVVIFARMTFSQVCKDGEVKCPDEQVPCCEKFKPHCKDGEAKCCKKKNDGSSLKCHDAQGNSFPVECKDSCDDVGDDVGDEDEKIEKTIRAYYYDDVPSYRPPSCMFDADCGMCDYCDSSFSTCRRRVLVQPDEVTAAYDPQCSPGDNHPGGNSWCTNLGSGNCGTDCKCIPVPTPNCPNATGGNCSTGTTCCSLNSSTTYYENNPSGNKCCRPCGSTVYLASEQTCCSGTVYSGVGQACCGSAVVNVGQTCCLSTISKVCTISTDSTGKDFTCCTNNDSIVMPGNPYITKCCDPSVCGDYYYLNSNQACCNASSSSSLVCNKPPPTGFTQPCCDGTGITEITDNSATKCCSPTPTPNCTNISPGSCAGWPGNGRLNNPACVAGTEGPVGSCCCPAPDCTNAPGKGCAGSPGDGYSRCPTPHDCPNYSPGYFTTTYCCCPNPTPTATPTPTPTATPTPTPTATPTPTPTSPPPPSQLRGLVSCNSCPNSAMVDDSCSCSSSFVWREEYRRMQGSTLDGFCRETETGLRCLIRCLDL